VALLKYRAPVNFDPRSLGAQCDRCALRELRVGGPVPSERHDAPIFAVVGEAPGADEVEENRPFVGMSGKELTHSLKLAGISRGSYDIINAIACRPRDNRLDHINRETKRRNDAIKKANDAERKQAKKDGRPAKTTQPWLAPFDACKPRLYAEIAERAYANLLVVGKTGYTALLGEARSLHDVRGGMLDGWLARMDAKKQLPSFVELKPDGLWSESNPPTKDAQRVHILPALHPSFVLRQRRWTRVFRSDLSRAVRWFTGREEWVEPEFIGGMHSTTICPTADWLYEWLVGRDLVAYDTETDALEPLIAKVRCVSVGDEHTGIVIPLMSKEDSGAGNPKRRFYSPADERRVLDVLRWWWTSKDHWKVTWNGGFYDALVVEQNFGVTPAPIFDGMMVHRVVESELPHGLGFAASVYAGLSPAWKASRAATEAESDAELHRYAALDSTMTYRVAGPLWEAATARDQLRVLRVDMGMQNVAKNLHRIGIRVNVKRRDEWATILLSGGTDPYDVRKYVKDNPAFNAAAHYDAYCSWERATVEWKLSGSVLADKPKKPAGPKVHRGALHGSTSRPSYIDELRHHAGRATLNPNSVPQVRDLLFDTWRLPIPLGANGKPKLTGGGDPSTDDETIRALRIHPLVKTDKRIIAFLDALRFYRAKMKLYGTYLKRMVPNTALLDADAFDSNLVDEIGRHNARNDASNTELGEADEYEEVTKAAEEFAKSKTKVKGFLWPDQRIRADWKAHTTAVGRFACSAPNLLNIPGDLRDIFVPEDGHCYVGADADQIHMRIGASRWGLKKYLDVFERGGDPHALTALIINDDLFAKADGFPGGRWDSDTFIPNGLGKWSGQAKVYRATGKTVFYASFYDATVETVHRIVTSTEDDDGNLIYADLSLPAVRAMHTALMDGLPELQAGWDSEVAFYRANWCGVEPVLGRRRDFLDLNPEAAKDEGVNEIVNFPILAAEGSIMSKATVAFVDAFPFDHEHKVGLVHQNYDSMCAEVAADYGEVQRAAKVWNAMEAEKRNPRRLTDVPLSEILNPHLREAVRVVTLMQSHMTWREDSLPGVVGTAVAQWGGTLKEA